ncbi:hypothetical protein J3F84DRAFT_381248 [Trichoderma pleuroticola]
MRRPLRLHSGRTTNPQCGQNGFTTNSKWSLSSGVPSHTQDETPNLTPKTASLFAWRHWGGLSHWRLELSEQAA